MAAHGEPGLAERGSPLPSTSLRRRYERSAELTVAQQMAECVDYLQNPEVLVAEFVDAYCAVEAYCGDDEMVFRRADPATTPDITVLDSAPYSFTSLAWELTPLAGAEPVGAGGFDYVGIRRDPPGHPVLGVMQSALDPTPYLVLMRLLSSVAELMPPARLEMANADLFKGALGTDPLFDLHLLLSAQQPDRDHTTLGELTRDLADVFLEQIGDEWQFPDLIRSIHGLRRSGPAADSPLHVVWALEALPF